MLEYDLSYNNYHELLITHWHSDHFYGEDLAYRMGGYAQGLSDKLNVYGNAFVYGFYERAFALEGRHDNGSLDYHLLHAHVKASVGRYDVYPIPAQHGLFHEDCFIFAIADHHTGESLLYTHDTGMLPDQEFEYLDSIGLVYDLVSLDCTGQCNRDGGAAHMSLSQNVVFVQKLRKLGLITGQTKLVASHFSHNGNLTYQQMAEASEEFGIMTAYDGLEIEVQRRVK